MSYRYRPLKYARDGYRWWLDRTLWFLEDVVPVDFFILMESSGYVLMEDGSKIILE